VDWIHWAYDRGNCKICEHCNGYSGFIKGRKFLEWLSEYAIALLRVNLLLVDSKLTLLSLFLRYIENDRASDCVVINNGCRYAC
jgi:hypothetical protein